MRLRPLLMVTALPAAAVVGCLSQSGNDGSANAPATQCELCHADVQFAFAETKHAQVGQACAACHGRSARHSWSEDGHVRPDRVLKARPQVDALCTSCHKTPKHAAALNIDRTCSSCHAPHPAKQDEPSEPLSREDMPDEL